MSEVPLSSAQTTVGQRGRTPQKVRRHRREFGNCKGLRGLRLRGEATGVCFFFKTKGIVCNRHLVCVDSKKTQVTSALRGFDL